MLDEEEKLKAEAQSVSPTIDLNVATVDDLAAVRGIGRVLAQRIVDYRDKIGQFLSKDELLGVSGIGPSLLEQISPHLEVPEPEGQMPAEEMEEVIEFIPAEAPIEFSEMQEKVEEDVAPREGAASSEAVAPEPREPRAEPAEAVREPVAVQRGSRWGWLWSALLGGLLGLLGSLVVLSAINGALNLRHTPAMREMSGHIASLTQDASALRADVTSMRSELENMQEQLALLESLPGRVEAMEKTSAELGEAMKELEKRTDALGSRVGTVEKGVLDLQKRASTVEGFFRDLQSLLTEAFGSVGGAGE